MLCIVVADKFWSDVYLTNSDYASIGGLAVDELNKLEHEVLALLGFDLYIDGAMYEDYYRKLRLFYRNQRRDTS